MVRNSSSLGGEQEGHAPRALRRAQSRPLPASAGKRRRPRARRRAPALPSRRPRARRGRRRAAGALCRNLSIAGPWRSPGALRELGPRQQRAAAARHVAYGIEPEIDRQRRGVEPALFPRARSSAWRPAGRQRARSPAAAKSGSSIAPGQGGVELLGIVGLDAEAARRRRAGEHQAQARGAVFQIVQRLCIGRLGIGVVDAWTTCQGAAARPAITGAPAARDRAARPAGRHRSG